MDVDTENLAGINDAGARQAMRGLLAALDVVSYDSGATTAVIDLMNLVWQMANAGILRTRFDAQWGGRFPVYDEHVLARFFARYARDHGVNTLVVVVKNCQVFKHNQHSKAPLVDLVHRAGELACRSDPGIGVIVAEATIELSRDSLPEEQTLVEMRDDLVFVVICSALGEAKVVTNDKLRKRPDWFYYEVFQGFMLPPVITVNVIFCRTGAQDKARIVLDSAILGLSPAGHSYFETRRAAGDLSRKATMVAEFGRV